MLPLLVYIIFAVVGDAFLLLLLLEPFSLFLTLTIADVVDSKFPLEFTTELLIHKDALNTKLSDAPFASLQQLRQRGVPVERSDAMANANCFCVLYSKLSAYSCCALPLLFFHTSASQLKGLVC